MSDLVPPSVHNFKNLQLFFSYGHPSFTLCSCTFSISCRFSSSYGKSDLSPATSMHDADSGNGGGGGLGGGSSNPFTTVSSSNGGAPTPASMAAALPVTMRKGILKHSSAACNSATEWDAELDRMVAAAAGDTGELILPPPPPPQITVTDRSHCDFYQGRDSIYIE